MVEIANGLGQYERTLSPATLQKYLKYDFLDWGQVFVTLATSKISICLFLLRLSVGNKWRTVLHLLIALIVLTHIPLLVLFVVQCQPVNAYWDSSIQDGHCWSKDTVEIIIIAQGVISVVTDLVGAAFPVLLFWNAKLAGRTKVALCALMGLGIFTAVACVVRTALSGQIKSNNLTWEGIPNAIARIFEVNLGIIAACTPMMRYVERDQARFAGFILRSPLVDLDACRPLSRYVYARATGQDPRHFLPPRQRSLSTSSRPRWYDCFRLRGPSFTTARSQITRRSWETDATEEFTFAQALDHRNMERRNKQSVIRVAGINHDQKSSAGSLRLPLQGPRLASRRTSLGNDFCDERYGKRLGNHVEIGRGEDWPLQSKV